MAWLGSFLLGRPGYEYLFDINPTGMNIEEQGVMVIQRNLAGDLKKSYLKSSAPIIKINSNYLVFPQRDKFATLTGITDSFLSFLCRDDWQTYLEYDIPTDNGHVTIQNNSSTRLSAILAGLGFSGIITITGVFTVADGSGTNYFTGGTYDDATRAVTLGTPLPNATQPVYVTYTYKGWLVNMEKLPQTFQAGWVDRASYDVQLTGA